MERLIKTALHSYIVFNMDPNMNNAYIKSEDQKIMIAAITNRVMSTMTETEHDLLSLVYRFDTEENKKETIKFEVSLVVLDFVVSVNSDKK